MLKLAGYFVVTLLVTGYYMHRHNEHSKSFALDHVELGSGKMFDRIAHSYDKANSWMTLGGWHLQWKKLLARELDVYGTDMVLDVATGTGDMALELARAMKERGKLEGSAPTIVAVDSSSEMLQIAKKKLEKEALVEYVYLQKGSSFDLSFAVPPLPENLQMLGKGDVQDNETNLYDKVSVSFGLDADVNKRAKILEQIRRVTKRSNPNGKLAVLEILPPSTAGVFALLSPVVNAFIRYVAPALGAVATDGHWTEYAYMRDSIYMAPLQDPKSLTQSLETAGFRSCESRDIFMGTVHLFTCSTYIPHNSPDRAGAVCDVGATGYDGELCKKDAAASVAALQRDGRRQRRRSGGGGVGSFEDESEESSIGFDSSI
jgi:demethylmenaquinone methyltransferase/2-methoxy-6-polyprenyl-1,4-benzoquinol methylase